MLDTGVSKPGARNLALGCLLLCALTVAMVVGALLLGFGIWQALTALAPEVGAAFLLAAGTAIASVLAVVLSKWWERRVEIGQEHRKQKIPVYEYFMGFWFDLLISGKVGADEVADKEMADFNREFTKQLITWGADEVLREYVAFRRKALALEKGVSATEGVLAFEKLLRAIRADLGHGNKGLAPGDLLSLFITDIDEKTRSEVTPKP